MIARLVLGYVLAVLAFIPHLTKAVGAEHSYKLAMLMTSEVPGTFQVYYDTGAGLREADSVAAPLVPERREYELPLPPGDYRVLRIDPGNHGGRYTIERAAIRRPDGSTYWPIPLAELRPVHQLSLIERTIERLVVDSPAGSNDPQLLYAPALPFSLALQPPSPGLLLARLLGYVFAAVLLIALLERAMRPVAPAVSRWLQAAAHWSDVHPRSAVLVAAATATLIATYPILFLNRSLVSPNNFGTALLYDRLPFLPGSHDVDTEDVRGSDVAAMMWAFLPYSVVEREALSEGEVPLWNRFNGAGRSLWGQGQSFLLDPLHWFSLMGPDWGWDLKFVAHRFVFAAGVGLAALVAVRSWLPAVVAAAAVPFLGYFTFRFNHTAAFSVSYAPWILAAWFAVAAAQTRTKMARAALLLTMASVLLLLASSPKEAVVTSAACHAAGLLALVLCRQRAPGSWARLVWPRLGLAAAAGAATITLTAPHWMVFLDTLRASVTAYDRADATFSPPLVAAPQLLLGSLSPLIVLPVLQIAAVPLLIAPLVCPRSLLRRPAILACFITAACLIAVAFGAIPAAWIMRVPFIANIHQINNTTIAAAIVLFSVACAAGVDALLTASLTRASIVTFLVGLTGILLLRDATRRSADQLEPWLIGLLLAGLTAVPLSVQAIRRPPGRLLPLISLMTLGALVLLPGGLHVETGVPALDRLLTQPRLRVHLEATSPVVDGVQQAMTEPGRVVGLGHLLRAGSQGIYHLEGVGGPDALPVRFYEELVDAAGIERPDGPLAVGGWLTLVSMSGLDRVAPLLDMLNVGFVLAPSESVLAGLVEVQMQGSDRLKAFRRPTAWPRAFFVDGVTRYAEPREFYSQVVAHRKPLAAVQATDRQGMDATRGLPGPSAEVIPARGYKLTANTTSFVVRAPGPGVVVLTETFLPDDFRATLNGERVDYFRVNHAFKAVAIPSAGEWAVKFEYRPRRWNLSLAIAGFGVLLLTGLCLLGRDKVARHIQSTA